MLQSQTKRKLDAAHDILVGKTPSPTDRVDQITYALVYKFMSDIDRQARDAGETVGFFANGYEQYRWERFLDKSLPAPEKMRLYSEALEKMSQNPHIPQLFRDIFKGAFLPYRDPEVLKLFLEQMNEFSYSHSEELGNAFEYILHVMGSQGDAGMFRTPRHIIDFIVETVEPKKTDRILDPACGTAGFLVAAYKYLEKKGLTQNEKLAITHNVAGYDISPQMVRLSRVNLYLHHFPNPQIQEYDTLGSLTHWDEQYDTIFANPPFMTPKGGVKPHNRFQIQAKKSEALFVDYILEHLSQNGKAGIIVPEGIIFKSENAYKQLRKMLVDGGFLWGVVSLPSGVFNPYAGVKTSILLVDRTIAKQSNEIVFLKVEKEGYDLGAQRRPLCTEHEESPEWCPNHSDLPAILEIAKKWKNGEKVENKLALYVPKEKIIESGDYNLSAESYKKPTGKTSSWPIMKLGGLCEITTGRKDVNQGNPDGKYPFFTCAKEHTYIDTYTFDTEALLVAGNGDVGAVKYYKGKFDAYQRTYVLSNFKSAKALYLYYVLGGTLKEKLQLQKLGNTMPFVKLGMLQDFEIPLPPLEIQQQIVTELDGYQNIIAGARQVVDNWKPNIEPDPKWEILKIGDICKIERGASPRPIDQYTTEDPNGFNWVKIGDTKSADKYITHTEEKITKAGAEKSRKVFIGDFVLSNSMSFGRPYIMKIEGYIHDGWLRLSENTMRITKDYLYYILSSSIVSKQFERIATGGVVRNLNSDLVSKVEIPIPPIDIQNQIVEKIEAERAIVDANKKLITMYEQKMKDVISKLWNN